MPTPERVQPYKSEATAAGGSDAEAAPYPVLIKPQSEALDAAGLYIQDLSNYDYSVYLSRSGSDLLLTDVTTGAIALSNLSNLLLNYKRAVVAASVGSNLTLSGTYTLDGYGLSVGERVLVKDQTTGANNGIYITAAGAWTRATDMDSSAKALLGLQVGVLNGTLNGGTFWRMSNTSAVTLGTTALTFAAITRSVIAGNGMTGGGLLSSDVTITMGLPTQITTSTINAVSSTSHTHTLQTFDTTVKALTDLPSTYPASQISAGQTDTTFPEGRANTIITVRDAGSTYVTQFATPYAGGTDFTDVYVRQSHGSWGGGGWTTFAKLWTDRNDGTGSGLDADLLDGLDSTAFTQVASHSALSVYGRNVNSPGSAADIAAGVTTGPFWSNGSGLGFRKDAYSKTVAPTSSNDSSQSYATGSLWLDSTRTRASLATTVGVGTATWACTYDGPTTCLVVGNALEGDTLRTCDYLDPGDGTGIASALGSGGTAKVVFVRRGTYTLAATQALLSVHAGWTLRGEGPRATTIKPRIGNAATSPWACISLAGDGAAVEDLGFSIRDRAATIPALTLPLGVVDIAAKNTRVSRLYVDIPGAFTGAEEPFCVVAMNSTSNYGGQVVSDVLLNASGATFTGHASNPVTVAAIVAGPITPATDVAATLATTTAEPLFERISITGGACSDAASPPYYTYGVVALTLAQFTLRHCDFRGVYMGVLGGWTSTTTAITTIGPVIEQMRVITADGLAATGLYAGGVTLYPQQSGSGTLTISRIHVTDLYNVSGATGTHPPGVIVGTSNTSTRDVRIARASCVAVSSSATDVLCNVTHLTASFDMSDVHITDCTMRPAGAGLATIIVSATSTGTVRDAVVCNNRVDTLSITGAATTNAIVANNRIRSASGYSDTGTGTSPTNNIIG